MTIARAREEQRRAPPRWPSGRARAGGSASRRPCRPWYFSGGGRSDLASSAKSSTRSDSSPRRERKTRAVDADEVAEVEVEQALACAPRRARRRAPGAGCGRSGRRGRGTPSCPGRGARRGGRRRGSAPSVSSPRLEVVVRGPDVARSASTPGKACGNGSMPVGAQRARASRARGASEVSARPARSSAPGRSAATPTSILVILSLRVGPLRQLAPSTIVAALVAEQRLADRRLVGELVLRRVGLGRADDRVLDRLAGLLVLDVDDRADPDDVGRELVGVDDRARSAASPRAGRSAPRASPARSWRRRTRSSPRCRRTRAPP